MNPDQLPVEIDPVVFAERRRRLSGRLTLRALPGLRDRLYDKPADPAGEAELKLLGGVDEDGVRYLSGTVTARVELLCQRCLGPFSLPVRAEFLLGLVDDDDDAMTLQQRYEPQAAAPLRLAELAANELLLALPLVPKHPEGECTPLADAYRTPHNGADRDRQRPFSGLSDLLKD